MSWVLGAVVAVSLAKPVDAPITEVTVYSDRARVTRVASVPPGTQSVEFPWLYDNVDVGSIRVESSAADVRRVDIARLDSDELPVDEAKALLEQIEKLSDQRAQLVGEEQSYSAMAAAVSRLSPAPPASEPLKPPAHLNPSGWGTALGFVDDWSAKLQSKARELALKRHEVDKQLEVLSEKAAILGGVRRRSGHRVVANVSASQPAKVALTYIVSRARWYPTYDIQLVPDKGHVQLSFYGQVSQETGEDWTSAALTLSTAIPASSTELPKLASWKIGQKDRFIPTPPKLNEQPRPPPPSPPLIAGAREQDLLRNELAAVSGGPKAPDKLVSQKTQTFSFDDVEIDGELAKPDQGGTEMDRPRPRPPPPPPMAAPMEPAAPAPVVETAEEVTVAKRAGSVASAIGGLFKSEEKPVQTSFMSLAPPGGYVAPWMSPDLPASLAGGYDLSYASLRPETVASGKNARVALFTQTWPVTVERKLYPALTSDAFLVAELKSPSPDPLPGGNANLFVGADPAGVAQLKLVSPQESFTLPLGIDRAVKPIRNVQVIDAEKGVIGKDDVSQYVVTIELANPYGIPIQTRILDQWPLTDDKHVEVKLLKTEPWAIQNTDKGTLEWHIAVAPHAKTTVSFEYSIRRPKSWLMHQ